MSTVFVIAFNKKDYTETLQAMEILLLEALREEKFGHELQQMSSYISSDLRKFKLETHLKTSTNIVDEKKVGIKNDITIISSLNYISKAVSIWSA